ncbi:MAG: FprA family A-type flavoprotein [Deltaproteobacteria bacterium]|nr:FprA family A-type flavoprotein [Deltaproteobacteria bacterium]MBW2340772.1 FprA family A-type flavoprotein [Deltaproteobacteria bacterium]
MPPVEILKDIYWVGAIDWNIRDFHGYSVDRGTTYNAFLLMDDKITLFDTVKKGFKGDLLKNIRKIIDPTKIDYLVVNHVEMDHSSLVPEIAELVQPEKIFCSEMGKKNLLAHFHTENWPYEVVKTGDSISLGKRTVQFIETRMLHWPDSMFSYIPGDRLLISSDAFGQHLASTERFDDEVDLSLLLGHAAKYYANIILPYSNLVQKLLAQVKEINLAVDMIAPDHGLIWRKNPGKILECYDEWSQQRSKLKALVIYDTMWHSTEMMAQAIMEGLVEEGVSARSFDLAVNHRSDIITEVLDAGALIIGSSTLNNGMLPQMADLLHYMRGLRPANKIGAAFGSYGWSGEAVKLINTIMEEMKFRVLDPGIRVQYVPTQDDLKKCVDLGRKVARTLKEQV